MKRVMGSLAFAVAAVLTTVGSAQAACEQENGYKDLGNDPTSTFGAVVAAAESKAFTGNNVAACTVKEVDGASTKRKPPMTTTTEFGVINTEQCSLYNSLSSIKSKVALNKVADALQITSTMITKVNGLVGTGKLTPAGAAAINAQAADLQTCITGLL